MPLAAVAKDNAVLAEDKGVVSLLDRTSQNDGNAVGVVLGGLATVLVGD